MKLLSGAISILVLVLSLAICQAQTNTDSLQAIIDHPSTAPKDRAATILHLARHYLFQDPQQTIELSEQAVALAGQLGDQRLQVDAHTSLGSGYWSKGFLYDAFIEFEKALKQAISINYEHMVAQNYGYIGNVYNDLGNHSLAINYYYQALPLFRQSSNVVREAAMQNNIGRAFVKMKLIDSAIVHLEKAATLSNNSEAPASAVTIYNLADVYYLQGDKTKALKYLKTAFELAESSNEMRAASIAYTLWARIKRDEGDLDSALLLSSKSVALSSSTGIKDVIYQAYHAHSEILASKKRYEEAYHFGDLYQHFRDSLQSVEVLRRLDFFEFEKKETELSELKARTEAEEYRSWIQRLVIIGMGVILLLLVILIFTIYRSRQKLAASNTQLTQKNQEVIEKSSELAELNRLKDKLFSIIAHDLRAPLTSLSTALEMAQANAFDKKEFDKLLAILSEEVDQSAGLLDNLLVWSRSQLGGIQVKVVPFTLAPVVDDVVALLSHVAGNKSIAIDVQVPKELTVVADIDNVKLILRNLISNAIKYSGKGGKIIVSAQQDGTKTVLFVRDFGIGMDQSTLATLFTLNTRSTAGTSDEKGSGLGLVLVKEFVTLNHGAVSVSSEPGQGTTFRVEFLSAAANTKTGNT